MQLDLSRSWNGEAAPPGLGGRARLAVDSGLLVLTWDLALPTEPRVPSVPVGYVDGLWEHDVIELFVAGGSDRHRYLELEFGFAGHRLALAFDGPRNRVADLREVAPEVISEVRRGRWRGRAALPVAVVEKHAGRRPWHGLTCAVTGPRKNRVHLCWPRLPGERPDFHQPQAWAPMLPRPCAVGAVAAPN